MEKCAKKGLGVGAGGSGRQAPWAFVSFKNSLRLFFFSVGSSELALKLFVHPTERGTNILMFMSSRNKAEVKL